VIQVDTKLNCFIEFEGGGAFLYVNLLSDIYSMVLEYADITEEFKDFVEINNHFNLYNGELEIANDLEEGHLRRFLGQPIDNDKLDLMSNLRMKMRHNNGTCNDSCILCNPDIGDDPFPDFTFNIRNIEPEGEA